MDTNHRRGRRRQHRSCDQCRKGKRACDATATAITTILEPRMGSTNSNSNIGISDGHNNGSVNPCSNCKRWKKQCTFNWLLSRNVLKLSRERQRQERCEKKKRVRRDIEGKRGSTPPPVPDAGEKDVTITPVNEHQNHSDVPKQALYGDKTPAELPSENLSLASNAFSCHASDRLPDLSSDGQTQAQIARNGSIPELFWEETGPEPKPGMGTFLPTPSWESDTSPGTTSLGNGETCWPWMNVNSVTGNSCETLNISNLLPGSYENTPLTPQQFDYSNLYSLPLDVEILESSTEASLQHLFTRTISPPENAPTKPPQNNPFFPSYNQTLTQKFARKTLAQDLLRIYHDSMENALSCWLTERNCPYTFTHAGMTGHLLNNVEKEWGPNWSNRICTRVCRLDRAYSAISGRRLSGSEERVASRALHTCIMAFASQWARNSNERVGRFRVLSMGTTGTAAAGDTGFSGDRGDRGGGGDFEHSIQENLWNQARGALNDAIGILSSRVVLASMIFSLTQRPLNVREQIRVLDSGTLNTAMASEFMELHELFDNDCPPEYLENGLRQLFTLRYKLTRREREKPKYTESNPVNPEDHETFNLLFWLGIMFDTVMAAMCQRPPVVSDEDTEITCTPPSPTNMSPQIDLDGWDVMSSNNNNRSPKTKLDLWGDLFLDKRPAGTNTNTSARWPFTYTEAAEILSDAAPVKVLLFRRVSRLQTLIYRGVDPERLEEAIQQTLLVYQHWNCTYGPFMLNCMNNHASLPARIQSWYAIIAAHWHLAAMLLADTIEGIDQAGLGVCVQQGFREAMRLVPILRKENALAVCRLAECSLRGREKESGLTNSNSNSKSKGYQFHDSVNDGAFLTEPWTVVLIRSFTKAGQVLLDDFHVSSQTVHPKQESYTSRQVRFCIDALWCLGRKSDMSFLAARALENGVDRVRCW